MTDDDPQIANDETADMVSAGEPRIMADKRVDAFTFQNVDDAESVDMVSGRVGEHDGSTVYVDGLFV